MAFHTFDLAMTDLGYEYSEDGVHKEVKCTNKKKLSLLGDIIIYTPEDLIMN